MAMADDFRLGGMTSYLVRAQAAYCTERLRQYNITYGQFPFIRALYREDGINQETLAKKLLFNKATIARAIDKLEYAGYVSRTRDECDGRANKIYLTSNAWDIKPAMDQISNEWNLILTSGFTEIEKILIKELMKKIVSSVMCEMEQDDITVLSELMK